MTKETKCLIIGSGPAGYTAGIYASRAQLSPVIVEGGLPGGQLTQTTDIENYPGYPDGVSGFAMMGDLRRQAERFGAVVVGGTVAKVDFSGKKKSATLENGDVYCADTVIICTGASPKYLGLADEVKYAGMGVSACATCDGFLYKKRTVAVVGGGDTACTDVVYLSGLCRHVYLIVRKPFLRATQLLRERVGSLPNVSILYEHEVNGLYGEDGVEGADLLVRRGKEDEHHEDLKIDGLFLAIGHTPNSKVFKDAVETDGNGYIVVRGNGQQTSVDGVYAAGDVCDPVYQQAVNAAASGCRAALEVIKHLG